MRKLSAAGAEPLFGVIVQQDRIECVFDVGDPVILLDYFGQDVQFINQQFFQVVTVPSSMQI